MGLNWLITGGCGFIGRNLVKNLLTEEGHGIRIIDNLSVGTKEDLSQVCSPGDIEFIQGDILDADLMVQAAKGIDVIVHLAANTGVAPSVQDPRSDCLTNVIGTLNSLEAARFNHVKRFVFASSGAPAGECEPPITETMPPRPVSPYGASKLAGEGYCSAFFRSFGIETIALRFGNVYGEYSGHKDSVVAKFIKYLMNNKPLEIYGDGSQTRDFIYIADLIKAVRCAAIAQGVGGEIFQIATNRETSVKEMADIIIDQFKNAQFKNEQPEKGQSKPDIQVQYSEKRTGDVQRNYSDTSKARKMLKWSSETELKTGIEKTIQWFLR
ncbi:MAG: GDP-mannose 4,6-dehydratase [Desulfobacula sp.]|jgi:UDP-glucose 4-epimerase|nr:GDP-mannose 4,6-dehydratase [Desulfobacula sp.]